MEYYFWYGRVSFNCTQCDQVAIFFLSIFSHLEQWKFAKVGTNFDQIKDFENFAKVA